MDVTRAGRGANGSSGTNGSNRSGGTSGTTRSGGSSGSTRSSGSVESGGSTGPGGSTGSTGPGGSTRPVGSYGPIRFTARIDPFDPFDGFDPSDAAPPADAWAALDAAALPVRGPIARPPRATPLERLATRAEWAFPSRPFSEARGVLVGQVKVSLAAKEAFAELREELEVATGERLTQPEAFDVLLAFAAQHRGRLARWASALPRRS